MPEVFWQEAYGIGSEPMWMAVTSEIFVNIELRLTFEARGWRAL